MIATGVKGTAELLQPVDIGASHSPVESVEGSVYIAKNLELRPNVFHGACMNAVGVTDMNQIMQRDLGWEANNTEQMMVQVAQIFSSLFSQLDITALSIAFGECMACNHPNMGSVPRNPCLETTCTFLPPFLHAWLTLFMRKTALVLYVSNCWRSMMEV